MLAGLVSKVEKSLPCCALLVPLSLSCFGLPRSHDSRAVHTLRCDRVLEWLLCPAVPCCLPILSVCLPSLISFYRLLCRTQPTARPQLGEPAGAAATSREGGDGVGGEREGEAG